MVTPDDVRARLFGIDISKLADSTIQVAIDESDVELTYLRKESVPDNIFELAVAAEAAWRISFRFVDSTSINVLGYATGGRNEFLKNMKNDAVQWRIKVVKKSKVLTS